LKEEAGKMLAKAINRNWNLLQEAVPEQIKELIVLLNSTIENTNVMSLE
jgi:hypothetical protein